MRSRAEKRHTLTIPARDRKRRFQCPIFRSGTIHGPRARRPWARVASNRALKLAPAGTSGRALRCLTLLLCCLQWAFLPPAQAMSEKEELEVGRKMHEEILASMPVYANARVQEYVGRIGQHLARHSDRPDLEYTFTVIDSSDINAFAIPGGYVYVNRGLLAYLDSEAQLAGVLSHEIAHVTERHASRQEFWSKASNATSTLASILVAVTTGSGAAADVVGDTGQLLGAAVVRGYGRDMELEADREGAKVMLRAGYDPEALVDVIGLLKDQESFSRYRAKTEGKKPISYHGVFSTHPRNDQRLQEVVGAAGTLPEDARKPPDKVAFTDLIEGMKFADDPKQSALIDNRYFNDRLDFTVAFPSGWKVVKRNTGLAAGPDRDNAILQLTIRNGDAALSTEEYLSEKLGIDTLLDKRAIDRDGITGLSARYPDKRGGPERRVALLNHNGRAYIFVGRTSNETLAGFYDSMFLSTIGSFRPLDGSDRERAFALTVHYIRAEEGTTFEKLAASSPLKDYPEEQLRILNGYYPRGEPKPGEWIKIVR